MNKINIKIFYSSCTLVFCVIFLILACFIFGACSQQSGENKDIFVGSWHMIGISSNGETFNDDDMKLMQELNLTSTLNLTSSNKVVLEHMGKTYTGEWIQYSDSNIKLNIGGKSQDCILQDEVLSVDVNSDVIKFKK